MSYQNDMISQRYIGMHYYAPAMVPGGGDYKYCSFVFVNEKMILRMAGCLIYIISVYCVIHSILVYFFYLVIHLFSGLRGQLYLPDSGPAQQ